MEDILLETSSPRLETGKSLISSPPTSPTKRAPPTTPTNGDSALPTPSNNRMRARANSAHFEDYLQEYVTLKCKEKLTRKDFEDESTMESLRQLPLFQAIQVIHRFNDSVGPRVVNRSAFLVSIIRSTSRWWNNNASTATKMKKEIPLSEDGPNTHLIVQLCMNGVLNPDVFTPSVCHALQLLTPEQIMSVSQNFGSNALALHVADDSYYAKQQLFLSMAHAALMQFPPSTFSKTDEESIPPEATAASEAAELGRRRADMSAAAQLPGLLSEFIARTCASSNQKIKESDLDGAARDALQRVAFLQAMQAMQHFSVSIESDQVQKKSAYLMGILRGQQLHWERSRASKHCAGGAKDLLNLHPRLLLRIAHLCLDGNLLPSDFSPEVCLELKELEVDSAVKCVLAFNANKRICAGEQGGVKNRVGFFLGVLRNFRMEGTTEKSSVVTVVSPNSHESGLNASAKPFTPSSMMVLINEPELSRSSPLSTQSKSLSEQRASPVASTITNNEATRAFSPPSIEGISPKLFPVAVANSSSPMMLPPSPAANGTKPMVEEDKDKRIKELSRLLDSSRDAIGFLTSTLARSRTNELRLRRELQETQSQVVNLMQALRVQREGAAMHIESTRNMLLVNMTRSFDGLIQAVLMTEENNTNGPNNTNTAVSAPTPSNVSPTSPTTEDTHRTADS